MILRVVSVLFGVLVWSCVAAAQFDALPGSNSPFASRDPLVTTETLLETDAVHADTIRRAVVRFTIAEGWHVNSDKPLERGLIATQLKFEETAGLRVIGTVYPEPIMAKLFGDDPMPVYEHTNVIGVLVQIAPDAAPGTLTLKGNLQYQACNDTQCMAPTTAPFELAINVVAATQFLSPLHEDVFASLEFYPESPPEESQPVEEAPAEPEPAEVGPGDWQSHADAFTVTGRNSGLLYADDFMDWVGQVESGEGGDDLNTFAGKSVWLIIALTVLGGLALNLTPCVLPLIPINLAIIGAGAQAQSRRRGFALGGTYGLGIALAYGAVGSFVVLTTGSFGALNALWWFNGAIAVVFVVLGLAMFDLLLIDFSKYQAGLGIKKKEGGSYLVAFIMGAVSALLAGACVGPVIIAMVLYARDVYAAGSVLGLVLPFLLGVGMALPWPFAGGGLSLLPKPGKWMTKVKYAFGVFIIGTAAYYGYQAWGGFRDQYLTDRDAVASSIGEMGEHGWIFSLEDGMATAKAEGKPLIVDFWATWCKNCDVMSKTTFVDPNVVERLEGYIKVKYQAQFPNDSPHREVMEYMGVASLGLPVYVILEPN
jgi:cytochrome c biogenesis protein CcdA